MFCGFVDYHKLCLFCTLADENQVFRIICSSNCANRSLFPDCGNILIYKSTGLNLQDGMVGCTQSKNQGIGFTQFYGSYEGKAKLHI